MRHSTLDYYSAHEYEKLSHEFYEYKQKSAAQYEQCKAAIGKMLPKLILWQESYKYEFEDGKFYILYNSHTDEIFFSVGPPSFKSTHFLLGNNIPKP